MGPRNVPLGETFPVILVKPVSRTLKKVVISPGDLKINNSQQLNLVEVFVCCEIH